MNQERENKGKDWNSARYVLLVLFFTMVSAGLLLPGSANAEEGYGPGTDRFKINLGAYFPAISTTMQVDIGDTPIDLEETLNLGEDETVLRLDGYWRFAKKHRLGFGYYRLNRDASTYLSAELPIGGGDPWPADALIASDLTLDFYQLNYMYSFYQGEKWEIGGTIGPDGSPVDLGEVTQQVSRQLVKHAITARDPGFVLCIGRIHLYGSRPLHALRKLAYGMMQDVSDVTFGPTRHITDLPVRQALFQSEEDDLLLPGMQFLQESQDEGAPLLISPVTMAAVRAEHGRIGGLFLMQDLEAALATDDVHSFVVRHTVEPGLDFARGVHAGRPGLEQFDKCVLHDILRRSGIIENPGRVS